MKILVPIVAVFLARCGDLVWALVPSVSTHKEFASLRRSSVQTPERLKACVLKLASGKGWTSDFDDFVGDDDGLDYDDEDGNQVSGVLMKDEVADLSGSDQRSFCFGSDLVLSDFSGSMGFDEVVDWEYFDNPGEEERNVVNPPPFDPTKPKRTRSSSGSVVRLFRGELGGGTLGGTLRSRGLDSRVLVKEFSGDVAMELAKAEMKSLGRIQSALCAEKDDSAKDGAWAVTAASRYANGRLNLSTKDDDANLVKLVEILAGERTGAPFVGILGKLNLDQFLEDEEMDPNEWYRALGVSPPKPGSIWIVYEYAGLSTLANYAQPALIRRANMPMRKGVFGNMIAPPPLPPWKERANYVVNGVMKQALEAVAFLHENGIAHRSIGKTSIILSSVGMDKVEASSPYAVVPSRLVIKLSDFGFAGPFADSSLDESFRARARAFGIDVKEGTSSVAASGFAMAEDLHALGFVFLAALLSTLAEPPTEGFTMPATDEDSLQRLLGEIFNKDMDEFREYCEAEEIWTNVVDLLDANDGAGWDLLQSLCFARERAAENKDSFQLLTARGLLSNPLFQGRR